MLPLVTKMQGNYIFNTKGKYVIPVFFFQNKYQHIRHFYQPVSNYQTNMMMMMMIKSIKLKVTVTSVNFF